MSGGTDQHQQFTVFGQGRQRARRDIGEGTIGPGFDAGDHRHRESMRIMTTQPGGDEQLTGTDAGRLVRNEGQPKTRRRAGADGEGHKTGRRHLDRNHLSGVGDEQDPGRVMGRGDDLADQPSGIDHGLARFQGEGRAGADEEFLAVGIEVDAEHMHDPVGLFQGPGPAQKGLQTLVLEDQGTITGQAGA